LGEGEGQTGGEDGHAGRKDKWAPGHGRDAIWGDKNSLKKKEQPALKEMTKKGVSSRKANRGKTKKGQKGNFMEKSGIGIGKERKKLKRNKKEQTTEDGVSTYFK